MSDMSEKKISGAAGNQSTEKALLLLELMSSYNTPMKLQDISAAVKLPQSTVSRYLSTLIKCGYVYQAPDDLRYMLTYKLCRLANQFELGRDTNFQRITHPILARVSAFMDESAAFAVERESVMVYADVVTGIKNHLVYCQSVGNSVPMYCSAEGKVCLLRRDEDYFDRFFEIFRSQWHFFKHTENTIADKYTFLSELEKIRGQGYAVDDQELEDGMICVACAVYDYTNEIIGAVSVSGPASRMVSKLTPGYIGCLADAAREISIKLGHEPSSSDIYPHFE